MIHRLIDMIPQELALAGTFRAALHGRVVVLVGSLLSALLAHLERHWVSTPARIWWVFRKMSSGIIGMSAV